MVISRLILLLTPALLFAQSDFDKFKQEQNGNFKQENVRFIDYKKAQDKDFEDYLKKEREEILAFKKKLKKFWPEAELSSAKKLINYSKDLKTKSIIDFKNNEVIISQISTNKKDAEKKLLKTLQKTLNLDTQEAFKNNILEQKIDRLSNNYKYIKKAKPDKIKLLDIKEKAKSIYSQKTNIDKIKIIKKGNIYQVKYKLPKNSTYRRSLKYLPLAKSNASRFKLKANWLLAIMHTESSFNPMAKSYVPAYGLMQIVPRTAGIDSYKSLYKKRRLLSASYLYNTKNNIEIGSSYFHILYYKYLSSIRNPQSRLYCAIAGYNTGAGNVARAFVNSNNVKKASVYINKMSPEQVYNYLLKNLKYDEPKHYLKRVRARSMKYKELFHL